jgi:ribose 5-phosphate isomerase B
MRRLNMKIGFASDHRGYKLKEYLKNKLNEYEIVDYGTNSEESTDYPDYAFKLGESVVNGDVDFGVAICGSGIGISIACNKVKGVRCAKVTTPEEAMYTRNDNDSNIVAFGEKTTEEDALNIVKTFISTPFSNAEKHQRRIDKMTAYEEGNYEW